jgi:rod shape-determining protein MreB
MDDAIVHHLKRRHNLLIGQPTAERIKCEIGSAAPLEKTVADGSKRPPSL